MATRGKRDIDEQLVLALAVGGGIAGAARAAGVSERTVRRRMEDAGFREAVRKLRGDCSSARSGG